MDRYNDVKILLKKWEQSFFQTNNRKPNKVWGSVYFMLLYLWFPCLVFYCVVELYGQSYVFNIVLFTDICQLLWIYSIIDICLCHY